MRKIIIEIIVAFLLIGWGAISTTKATYQTKRVKELKEQVQFQQNTIDSIIKLPRETYQVELSVSDNSKTTLNARKQSGEITLSADRMYELKIDSLSIKKYVRQ